MLDLAVGGVGVGLAETNTFCFSASQSRCALTVFMQVCCTLSLSQNHTNALRIADSSLSSFELKPRCNCTLSFAATFEAARIDHHQSLYFSRSVVSHDHHLRYLHSIISHSCTRTKLAISSVDRLSLKKEETSLHQHPQTTSRSAQTRHRFKLHLL